MFIKACQISQNSATQDGRSATHDRSRWYWYFQLGTGKLHMTLLSCLCDLATHVELFPEA
jgi:hypothetical protein